MHNPVYAASSTSSIEIQPIVEKYISSKIWIEPRLSLQIHLHIFKRFSKTYQLCPPHYQITTGERLLFLFVKCIFKGLVKCIFKDLVKCIFKGLVKMYFQRPGKIYFQRPGKMYFQRPGKNVF